jgi:FkbM family methyltransferase
LKDDSVIFDIGANIGWYSLNLSGVVSKGKIFAFEPIPKTHDYLVRNIASNKITNVQVQNYGLSEKEGTLEFYFDPKLGGSTSLRNLNENSKKVLVKCKVKRLDQIAPSLSKTIDFIKCDVEGAELFVMRGAIETLKKCEPVIFLEMLRKWAKKFDYHPNEIIKLLGTLGYECYYAENGKLRKISEIDDNTMATNFFFLKPEKHAVLLKKMS